MQPRERAIKIMNLFHEPVDLSTKSEMLITEIIQIILRRT